MSSLVRLLAREPNPACLIAALHQSAGELTGATASVLLRPSPAGRGWIGSSAAGLESLPLDGWLDEAREAAAVGRAMAADAPLAVGEAARAVPQLAARLGGASSVVIVPLVGAWESLGVLLLASSAPEPVDASPAAAVGDAFVVAMERGALRDARAVFSIWLPVAAPGQRRG